MNTLIQTAAVRFGWSSPADRLAFVRQGMLAHGHHAALLRPMSEVAQDAPPAIPWIDHGRWLAVCPDPNCHGVEYVEPGQPFYCCSCANVAVKHAWRPIKWPRNRHQIEKLLSERPYPNQRIWQHGEPVANLRLENAQLAGARTEESPR